MFEPQEEAHRTARDRTEASALDPEDGDPMTAEVGDVHAMDNTEAGVDDPSGSAATTAEAETSAPSPLMDHVAAIPPDDGSLSDEEWLRRALDAARARDLVADVDALAMNKDDGDMADDSFDRLVEEDGSRDPPADTKRGPDDDPNDANKTASFGGWIPCDPRGNRTLLIDNYDSYTYNLYHLIAAVDGVPPVVVRNDAMTWKQLEPSIAAGHFARVVLSPGPGTPDRAEDVGVCADLLSNADNTPVLGVCLGHQCLAKVHGGRVIRAPVPMHGRLHAVAHDDSPLFAGIPSGTESRDEHGVGFIVTRYHSLVVESESLPECLDAIAWTAGAGGDGGGVPANETAENARAEDAGGVVMALRHKHRPHYGVQFHPESVCSEFGERLYRNFASLAAKHNAARSEWVGGEEVSAPRGIDPATVCVAPGSLTDSFPVIPRDDGDGKTRLMWMRLPGALASVNGGSEALFWRLFGSEPSEIDPGPYGKTVASRDTFWLDSATASVSGKCPRSRFSFMGGRGGNLWRRLVYALPKPRSDGGDEEQSEWRVGAPPPFAGGVLEVERADGARETHAHVRLLDYLDARLAARSCERAERVESWGEAALRRAKEGAGEENVAENEENVESDLSDLPFDFRCGFVGYLGYEMRMECDSPHPRHASPIPDAAMYFADRVVAVDHGNNDVYVLALVPDGDLAELEGMAHGMDGAAARAVAEGMVAMAREEAEGDARTWMAETERTVLALGAVDAETVQSGEVNMDPGASDRLVNAIGAEAVAALDACERMRREEAVAPVDCDAGAAYARAGGFTFRREEHEYVADVSACQRAIDRGETYEVCLTNELRRKGKVVGSNPSGAEGAEGAVVRENENTPPCAPDPATLYSVLRRTNPAPYAAYLCFGGCDSPGDRVTADGSGPLRDVLAVCCSSPERFLRLSPPSSHVCDTIAGVNEDGGGVLEAKPIKGTAPRVQPLGCDADIKEAANLATSVKDRAENLMIVDLLRNDLGRVCEPGTVSVPGLMKIESYASVHQLVSTVRGHRRKEVPPAACVAAAFPPGSMTGAPKFRTVEIIDTLEPGPRGVYSGGVGYMSVGDGRNEAGAFDFNVVIRTAVVKPGSGEVWLGSGGAITALSDPVGEWEEMTLKARAVLRAIRACDEAA